MTISTDHTGPIPTSPRTSLPEGRVRGYKDAPPMARASNSKLQRAFQFRGGVRVAGTVIACDAPAVAELVFVSHAGAWARSRSGGAAVATGSGTVASRRARHPRVQILTTPETLTLMGKEGERLRGRALMPGFGRPFALGFLRLELVPGGHQPGAAALLCDDGKRRMLYASTVSFAAGQPPATADSDFPGGEVRACDALCIDATFADPRFKFLRRAEADARLIEFVARSHDAGQAAVVLVSAHGPAQDAARTLRAAGWRLRADHAIVEASALYAKCGAAATTIATATATGATTRSSSSASFAPVPARFTGKLARDEVLLWSSLATATRDGTPQARPKSWAKVDRTICVAWLSEWAGDAERVARLGVDAAIPASRQADFEGLVSYILASGAREVATLHAPSTEALETALRARHKQMDVYRIGPPRQIGLFESRS